jgi:hypothetical protein
MSPAERGDQHGDEDEELRRVGEALGYDPDRQPPSDRVEAVRRQADRLRADRGAPAAAPPTLDDRRRGRRSLLVGGLAASVGVVVGAGLGALGRDALDDDDAVAVPTEPLVLTGVPDGVQAQASLINHTWGTEVLLDVSGLAPGEVFGVALERRDGGRTEAGSFLSVPDVLMVCRFNAAPLRADVAAVLVVGPDGEEVMRADLVAG